MKLYVCWWEGDANILKDCDKAQATHCDDRWSATSGLNLFGMQHFVLSQHEWPSVRYQILCRHLTNGRLGLGFIYNNPMYEMGYKCSHLYLDNSYVVCVYHMC